MRHRLWWATATLAGVAIASGIYFTRRSPSTVASMPNYVDPKLCAGCHANIWATYRFTGMARSFYRPSSANTIEDYTRQNTFYHRISDSYFTMLLRDGRYYQRRHQIGFGGKETNVEEKEIHYVMGSGNHVRTYLHRTSRNTLVELPLAWYAEKGGYWAMNPGYDRADHQGFRRKVSYDCMFCHNSYPEKDSIVPQFGKEPVFSARLPEGIDCQRCHGPGGKHVSVAQAPGSATETIRGTIVNPARLSPDREMEVCMQCHLETTSFPLPNSIQRYERAPFSYHPGEPLANFILYFDHAPGKGHDDKFEIAHAVYRLRRSACFQKSNGQMRCTTCHNPHDIPRGEQARQHYIKVCRQCHDAHPTKQVATDCLDCHMPKRRTEDVVHAVMTDHYIQRHKPTRNLLAEITERHETGANAYHGEVAPYYPAPLAATPENELYHAIVQVKQQSNLQAGIARLTEALEKQAPQRPEYYFELGDAWWTSGQTQKAMSLYEEAIRRQPDFIPALRKLAVGLRQSSQPARAAELLHEVLKVYPEDPASWYELGLTYLGQGRNTDAIQAFQRALVLDPDLPEAHNALGGTWMESGDRAAAETAFRSALRIQPDYAEAHNNLGNLLSWKGDFEQARHHFQAAVRLRPEYPAARYNYAVALAGARQFDGAQRQVEAALAVDPGIAEAHELLGNLLARKGQIELALSHYREAIKLRPDFARAHLSLGAVLAATGNSTEAMQHLQKAGESNDSSIRQGASEILQQLRGGR